jgi:MSHA pilin protein MshC
MYKRFSGFSMVELIVTLLVVGILAVAVAPRMFSIQGFDARGFYDQTMSILHYAQKTAIAQRRTVCVAFTSNSATLTIASAALVTTCNTNLTGPDGTAPYRVTARNAVTYTATPADFNFDGQGRPINNAGAPVANQVIQVSGNANTITIEAETGYAH